MLKAHIRAIRKQEAIALYRFIAERGYRKSDAAGAAARHGGFSLATLYRAIAKTKQEPEADHYFVLLPQWRGRSARAPFSNRVRAAVKADVMHRGRRHRMPRGYYARVRNWARRHGLPIPSNRTVQRYIAREVGPRFFRRPQLIKGQAASTRVQAGSPLK